MNHLFYRRVTATWFYMAAALALAALFQCTAYAAGSENTTNAQPAVESDQAASPEDVLATLEQSLHLEEVERRQQTVADHVIGLGAMKKVRGVWSLKKSDRLNGSLTSVTWRVLDGFSAAEVLTDVQNAYGVEADDAQEEGAELLFSCDGRACGHGAQWATRVFGQRLLYGRGDAQQYRAYSLGGGAHRLVIYAAVRSSDRQYLHVELLKLQGP